MKTVQIEVYEFNELSEAAKNKAREEHASSIEYTWWDSTYDDFVQVCEALHIAISDTDKAIWFDEYRAVWVGSINLNGVGETYTRILEYAPKDETLHAIAKRLDVMTAEFRLRLGEHTQITDNVIHVSGNERSGMTVSTDHMWEELAVSLGVDVDGGEADERFGAYFNELDTTALAIVEDLSRWLRNQLTAEYTYLISDESICERGDMYTADGVVHY